jgi:hypothetical protein
MSQNWEFPSPLSSGIELSPQHTVYETPPSQPVTPASFHVSGDLPNLFSGDATAISETGPAKYPDERLSSAELPFLTFEEYIDQLGPFDIEFPPAPSDEHVLQQSISAVAQLLDQEFPLPPSNQHVLRQPMQVPADYATYGHAMTGTEHRYMENVVSGPLMVTIFFIQFFFPVTAFCTCWTFWGTDSSQREEAAITRKSRFS